MITFLKLWIFLPIQYLHITYFSSILPRQNLGNERLTSSAFQLTENLVLVMNHYCSGTTEPTADTDACVLIGILVCTVFWCLLVVSCLDPSGIWILLGTRVFFITIVGRNAQNLFGRIKTVLCQWKSTIRDLRPLCSLELMQLSAVMRLQRSLLSETTPDFFRIVVHSPKLSSYKNNQFHSCGSTPQHM